MASKRWFAVTALTACAVWAIWWVFAPAPFATMAKQWAVVVTMTFGSLIAGATCEGGGAVAFPVFTKILKVAPHDARWFALAIQSVGMTAASLTIFAMRRTLDWGALVRAGAGGAAGILLGLVWLAPAMQPQVVRILFTMMQCGFAAMLLISFRNDNGSRADKSKLEGRGGWILIAAGLIGGLVSSLFGNGLDLITFSVLVLLFRVDERVATPTTVVLMASNALVGFAYGVGTHQYSSDMVQFWIAAVPVVVVGAPLGAIACRWLSRSAIVGMLVVLIGIELLTTLWLIPLTPQLTTLALATFTIFLLCYWAMSRCQRFVPDSTKRIGLAEAP